MVQRALEARRLSLASSVRSCQHPVRMASLTCVAAGATRSLPRSRSCCRTAARNPVAVSTSRRPVGPTFPTNRCLVGEHSSAYRKAQERRSEPPSVPPRIHGRTGNTRPAPLTVATRVRRLTAASIAERNGRVNENMGPGLRGFKVGSRVEWHRWQQRKPRPKSVRL
jgi:hypothetical protein